MEGECFEKFVDRRVNEMLKDCKNKKQICMIYVNKLLILAQDVLIRISSKVNGDKMLQIPSLKYPWRRCKVGALKKGWQQNVDEILYT